MSNAIAAISKTISERRPLPDLCCDTLEDGYRMQKAVTASINDNLAKDLKAGVTNAAMQQQLGLSAPLLGTLYQRGKLASGCAVAVVKGQQLEFEIGVMVDDQGQPTHLVPTVEVVYLAFEDPSDFSIANVVAANLGADRHIIGNAIPWQETLSDIVITVYRDGQEIATARNEYSFGTPADGVRWMVNEARQRGLWPSADQRLLMLGTCGQAIDAEAGDYRVKFEKLGEVNFTVTEQ
ncbi:MAG: hypothetical protein AseanaTS_13280 [Candidatus Pelagadaptatus aseana]|uniref:hypothetical protein n=1 Tax=Candidatus Pelagadaptatus aseana TaxID=3120508 RepID=UPI0039B1E55D